VIAVSAINGLMFGHKHDLPAVTAAWGARLIFPNDVVWDRTDAAGEPDAKAKLLGYLRETVRTEPFDTAARIASEMRGSESVFTLFDDGVARVVGSPHGNSGYLYVTAWLHEHEVAV
jgi:hypothetical protein